jgi:radical SAM protein with 4Fe4S-binding SPASM domain
MILPSAHGIARLAWNHPRYVEQLLIKKLNLLSRYRWIKDHPNEDDRVPPPLIYKFVLTYKCNLRCSFCYEWGDAGWCVGENRDQIAKEVPWEVIEKVMAEAASRHSSFILSGGEPLLYSRFRDFSIALQNAGGVAVTCTNGLLLDRYLDVNVGNPYLTYLVSLDGLEPQNDRLRGQGVYRRVTQNIQRLKSLKKPPYLAVQFTIRPENVEVMYDFCCQMTDLGADWILLNLCWFITEPQALAYEDFMRRHFGTSPVSHLGYLLPYDLDKEEFVRQYGRIRGRSWPIQISCYLEKPEDIYTFIDTPQVPPGNDFCYKQWIRMDITPDGTVAPCILYPDVLVGDLRSQSVAGVWNSAASANFRRMRRAECLPVCSKCDVLYLYDAGRRAL